VIGNLIDNALKHGDAGRTLIVKAHVRDARVHIELADRGDGIPPDEVSRVFDKFYRGKGASRRGTGLGLTIARRIVDEHGGIITMHSVIGQGTSVEVTLPVMGAHAG
jgi:two-component system sensor histidine kinase KdpD